MKKNMPIVGIVCYNPDEIAENKYYIPFEYIDSLHKSGVNPIIIPPGKDVLVDEIFPLLDGVILAGGGDVNPKLYGGNSDLPNVYGISDDRDQTEFRLIELALNSNKPILAICRGLQIMNVYLGGSLFENLEPDILKLHRRSLKNFLLHTVKIKDSSKILKQLGAEEIKAISHHHQALNRLGEGLVPVAFSEDGIVEACELPSHNWFLGVQWHPELTFSTDALQRKIFEIFVENMQKALKEKSTKVNVEDLNYL